MGIIKAAADAVRGAFADQWLEVIEPGNMGDQTVFSAGVPTRRGQNTKGTPGVVSNGSRIRVYPNQFMMLVDGGRVVDYTAEEGYYTVNNSMAPSLFNGQFGEALKESFDRIRFGGQTYGEQRVYYINLQEIKGLKFGTRTPVNYFDSFYNAELFLRAHGTYSVKITDPLKFYGEVIPKNTDHVEMDEINEQYLNEYMELSRRPSTRCLPTGSGSPLWPLKAGSWAGTWPMSWTRNGTSCAAWRSRPWASEASPTTRNPRS